MKSAMPDGRKVSVYMSVLPTIRGLMAWQWCLLALGMFAIMQIAGLHHLFWFPKFVQPLLIALTFSITVAVIGFPTGRHPLRYLKSLAVRAPLRPESEPLRILPNGAAVIRLYGKQLIVIGCRELPPYPQLCDYWVTAVSMFLAKFAHPCEFVTTTGRPDCDVHESRQLLPVCLIMCEAPESELATAVLADSMLSSAKDSGLELQPVDPRLFEAVAGHGFTSAHFIVEFLPFEMELGWLGELANICRDYTVTVKVAPANQEQAKKAAASIVRKDLGSYPLLFDYSPHTAMAVRQAARDLLDGYTQAYEVSVDIVLTARSLSELNWQKLQLKMFMVRSGARVKEFRSRKLPFLSAFHEPCSAYSLTVTQGAAVGCCPFFLFLDRLVAKKQGRDRPAN